MQSISPSPYPSRRRSVAGSRSSSSTKFATMLKNKHPVLRQAISLPLPLSDLSVEDANTKDAFYNGPSERVDDGTGQIVQKRSRGGASGHPKIFDDGEGPTLSTDAEAARATDSSLLKDLVVKGVNSLNELAPPVPFNYNDIAGFEDEDEDEDDGDDDDDNGATRRKIKSNTQYEADDVVEGASILYSTREDLEEGGEFTCRENNDEECSRRNVVDSSPGIDAAPPPQLGIGDSMIRVPEAWPVTNGDSNIEHGFANNTRPFEAEEVFMAKPLLPWWKQELTRLRTWALLCLFSTIFLAAHETSYDSNATRHPGSILITTCSSLSLAFSALFFLAHVRNSALSDLLVGTDLEGIVVLFLAVLWTAAMPSIMDPSNGLAVTNVRNGATEEDDSAYWMQTIGNANLFFYSWGAFISALTLFVMFVWERFGRSGGMGMLYTSKWCLLVLASFMTMLCSVMYNHNICSVEVNSSCDRNKYGFVTGLIGLIVSFTMSISSYFGGDSIPITLVAGFVMTVNYTVCAGTLSFGDGPATLVGNRYFCAWTGFYVSLNVFVNALREFFRCAESDSEPMTSATAVESTS